MVSVYEQVQESVTAIRRAWRETPEFSIVLGTGLGALVRHIDSEAELVYSDIPHFVQPTGEYHRGRVILGRLSGRPVILFEGRLHYYEGYPLNEIGFPVRVAKALGAQTVILTNIAGALNPSFRLGELVAIEDHIALFLPNPLVGPNDERLGPRFPDMSRPYDPTLIVLAEKAALRLGLSLRRGIYVGVSGPSLETRAEYRLLRALGADLVGMSTVPEAIVAAHAGLRCLGLSIVTDLCHPEALMPIDVPRIVQTAAAVDPFLAKLIAEIVGTSSHSPDR